MGKASAASGAKGGGRAKTAWHNTFLAELARTSNVAAAARKSGIDASTAYKTRRANSRFARQWFEALCEGYDNLEMDLLHRLREGELEGGAAKARAKRKFDNATAFRLLVAHRAAVVRQRARREDEDESAVYAAIHAKLEAMRDRAQALPELMARQPVNRLPGPDAQ